jgi:hypothetical protein
VILLRIPFAGVNSTPGRRDACAPGFHSGKLMIGVEMILESAAFIEYPQIMLITQTQQALKNGHTTVKFRSP